MSLVAQALRRRLMLLGMLLPLRLEGATGPRPEESLLEADPEKALEPPAPEAASAVLARDPGLDEPSQRREARPGERIASWVTSRGLEYASSDAQGGARRYSGRVYLPVSRLRPRALSAPLVVYVHGTEADRDNVPQYNRGSEAMAGAMAAWYHGFIVAMPDLPGYGHDPSPRPHPYCHAKSLALSVLDMIRPTLDLLEPRELRWDGRIFLLGYSSGGYGAMAAVKEWQTNARYAGLELTAAACMGGPFNFAEATRALLSDAAPYQRPEIQAYLLRAYHDQYPEAGVFAPAQALHPRLLEVKPDGFDQGNLPSWLEGADSGERVCQKIRTRLTGAPHTPISAQAIMNPEWLATQFLTPEWPDTDVGRILSENDLVEGWHPRVPMLLAASPEDECVQASNTFALMKAWALRGCSSKVAFHPLTVCGRPLDHATGGPLALEKAFRWFASGAYASA
jgi:hypothetical protein